MSTGLRAQNGLNLYAALPEEQTRKARRCTAEVSSDVLCAVAGRIQVPLSGGEPLGLSEACNTTVGKFRFISAIQGWNLQQKGNPFHFYAPVPFFSSPPKKKKKSRRGTVTKEIYWSIQFYFRLPVKCFHFSLSSQSSRSQPVDLK